MKKTIMWTAQLLMVTILLSGCLTYSTPRTESPSSPPTNKRSGSTLLTGKIVGYIQGSSMHQISQVDLSRLTHLIYSGIEVTNSSDPTLVCNYPWDQLSQAVIAGRAAGNKVLVSLIDTSNIGNLGKILSSSNLRSNLVTNINNLINNYNLDGVDIDYEYYDDPDHQTNVSNLVDDLYPILSRQGKLISVATAIYNHAVNSNAITRVDFFNVMTYCMQFPESSSYTDSLNYMNQFIAMGFPADKLLMGIPFFSTDAVGSGPSYREIIDFLNPSTDQNSAQIYSITKSGKLYAVAGGLLWWNGIDLARQKVDFVKNNGFGGMMVWEIGLDKYDDRSLLQTIYDQMTRNPVPASNLQQPGLLNAN